MFVTSISELLSLNGPSSFKNSTATSTPFLSSHVEEDTLRVSVKLWLLPPTEHTWGTLPLDLEVTHAINMSSLATIAVCSYIHGD
jgi:hypothetical protein